MTNILQAEGKEEILRRLDQLTENSQAQWGSMRVNEMLAHMNDAIKIALGMKPAANTSNFYTHHIMFNAAVYILPRWPNGEATAPELNQREKGTKAKDFYTEVEFTKKMLDIFSEREASKLHPHPMFGALSKKQWADLLYKHFQHHLRQFGV
jgi:Protein of unknown function (DUF1569)